MSLVFHLALDSSHERQRVMYFFTKPTGTKIRHQVNGQLHCVGYSWCHRQCAVTTGADTGADTGSGAGVDAGRQYSMTCPTKMLLETRSNAGSATGCTHGYR
eukprot:354196-Chlamydomonas_euryale.AAC.15